MILREIAEKLIWKGERSKQLEKEGLNEIELNWRLDEDWEIHQYTNR